MRNILLIIVFVLTWGATVVRPDVKKHSPFDLEAHNIAFAVDALVRERGWEGLDLSSTDLVFRALIDARSLDLSDQDKESFIKKKMDRFRIIANSEAVCIVDLQKSSVGGSEPLVLYFEYRIKQHRNEQPVSDKLKHGK